MQHWNKKTIVFFAKFLWLVSFQHFFYVKTAKITIIYLA